MMRRYIGRATGQHRGEKSWAFKPTPLFLLGAAVTTLLLAAVAVWFINPGSHFPDEEKGSRVAPGVTLPGDPTDPSGQNGTG